MKNYHRLMIGVLAIFFLLAALSCQTTDTATPEERAQAAQLEGMAQAAKAEGDLAAEQGLAAFERFKAALEAGNEIELKLARTEIQDSSLRIVEAQEALRSAQDGLDALYDSIDARRAEDARGAILPWIPAPFQAPVGALLPLGLGLIFRRPRRHLASAVGSMLPRPGSPQVDLFGAALGFARAIGWVHSTPASKVAAEDEQLSADRERLEQEAAKANMIRVDEEEETTEPLGFRS